MPDYIDSCTILGNTYEFVDTNGRAMIAPTEASATASMAHIPGTSSEYFILSGVLYQAITVIANGAAIVTSGSSANCKTVPGGIGNELNELKSTINNRTAGVLGSDSVSDLDISDESGNVIVRLKDGHIETKNFSSESALEEIEAANESIGEINEDIANIDQKIAPLVDAENNPSDLDVADVFGNTLVRFKDGGVQTKKFKGFDYLCFKSAAVTYTGSACTLTVTHPFRAGDRIVLHVERGAKSWSNGGVVTYSADNDVIFDEIQADCAYLEYTLSKDADAITANYSASATGVSVGDNLVLTVYLLGDVPILPTVIRVKKDGTGDYTTLRGALDAIGTQADDVIHPYRIEIYPGTYDVMDDYTDEEIAAAYYQHVGNGFVGPKLYNGMHLVGMGGRAQDVIINGVLSETDWTQTIRNYISPINMQGSCSVENVMIRAENVRYCIHSDFNSVYGKPIRQTLKNVILRGRGLAYSPNDNTYGSGIPRCGGYYLFDGVDFGLSAGLHTTAILYSNPTVLLKNCKGQSFGAYDYNQSTDPKSMAEYIFDGCDFTFVTSSKDASADQTLPHVTIRGTGGSSPMYGMGNMILYDTGDVQCSYKINEDVGTILELYKTSGTFWRKTITADKARGIIVYQTEDNTYIQTKGYVRTDRLGLASFSLYDYVGIDADSHPIIVQDSSIAIGQIVCANDAGTIGYMMIRRDSNV